jgi:hypothetical protein
MDWINVTQDGVQWKFLRNGNKLLGAEKFVCFPREFRSTKSLITCLLVSWLHQDCEHKSSGMYYFR